MPPLAVAPVDVKNAVMPVLIFLGTAPIDRLPLLPTVVTIAARLPALPIVARTCIRLI